MRRLVLLAAAILALPLPTRAAVPVVVIDGRGHGHGVGMAQDGAYWMARDGATTNQILGHFYPGTGLARAGGEVRVVVLPPQASNDAAVAFPRGGEVRDARGGEQSAGFPVQVPAGGRVRIRFDGARYTVEGGTPATATAAMAASSPQSSQSSDEPEPVSAAQVPTTTTTSSTTTTTVPTSASTTSTSTTTTSTSTTTTTSAPPKTTTTTTTTAPPPSPPPPSGPSSSRPLWAVPAGDAGTVDVPARARHYRGVVEATAVGSPLRLVNHLDVEAYLKGMGEVRNPRWPPAGLRAQAVAARTYALRAMAAGGELCDTQRCQVYIGAAAEYGAMNRAVDDTRGQVVVHGRRLASAVYSANGGGTSASRPEGFGTPEEDSSHPYLRAAPYPTQDPGPWTVQVALADVAARLGYRGQVHDVRVARTGPSGRALEVALDGTAGTHVVTGIQFDRALGLRSTLFTLRVGTSDTPPPPPEADDAFQDLPDVAAAPPPAPAAAGLGATDTAVPTLPAAPPPDPPAYAAARSSPRLPLPAAVGAVLTLLGTVMLALAWAVARRVGLSGRALGL